MSESTEPQGRESEPQPENTSRDTTEHAPVPVLLPLFFLIAFAALIVYGAMLN